MNHLWSPWRMEYITRSADDGECVFCRIIMQTDDVGNYVIARGYSCLMLLNRYPYTSGHVMVVPFPHVARMDDLEDDCRAEMIELANRSILALEEEYNPEGFNVGINIGEAAGAGITEHIHLHVVPRWSGDTNFMTAVSGARVLPETLPDTYNRLLKAWSSSVNTDDP